ncbi:SGNH/GDSL hydrolase family protein [Microbacterium sp. YY-01]|uniref:SGNH/GDSL hydrolase family protein n=1 Tax=Microbacterium sp. YY-01 TaxID=3421634 RepID=UPI003D183F6C
MTNTERERLRARCASSEPTTWVLTGDSITHGLVHTHGARNYVDHLHELIRGDLGRTRDVIINTGISGHRITQILDDFGRRVADWHPDVVTLMIGTNDAATNRAEVVQPHNFGDSLRTFVARVRQFNAIPVLQTPPFVDITHAPERARIAEFVAAVRAVAHLDDVILVDQHAWFTEEAAGGVPWRFMSDPFHPNDAGHAALALTLAEALDLHTIDHPERVLTDLRARIALAQRR